MFLPDEFAEVAAVVDRDDILMITAEDRVMGFNHAEVGKLLAEKWNLPAKLVQVIAHHHEPAVSGGFMTETAVVHLADILCRALNIGFGGDNKIPLLDKPAWESLKISTGIIEPLLEKIHGEFNDISTFIA